MTYVFIVTMGVATVLSVLQDVKRSNVAYSVMSHSQANFITKF